MDTGIQVYIGVIIGMHSATQGLGFRVLSTRK